jgi:hypothetical protein
VRNPSGKCGNSEIGVSGQTKSRNDVGSSDGKYLNFGFDTDHNFAKFEGSCGKLVILLNSICIISIVSGNSGNSSIHVFLQYILIKLGGKGGRRRIGVLKICMNFTCSGIGGASSQISFCK